MKIASHILSAYSFILSQPIEKLLEVGNRFKNEQPIPSFDEKLLIDLCSEAKEIFENEQNVLQIDGDLVIVGDIHGSLHDLLRILKFVYENDSKVLFLGDYIDRGDFSLECITVLLALKIAYPDSFYLIRGNHEFNSLCIQYGFRDEILNYHTQKNSTNKGKKQKIPKFCKTRTFSEPIENSINKNETKLYKYTEKLYNSFINVFAYLPISAIVNKTTFCIHGGLSPNLYEINDLNRLIKRPIHRFKESSLLQDVVWSDPQEKLSSCLFEENAQRGQGFYYNEETVKIFLKNTSLSRIVRAHQCVKRGILKCFDNKCITVFSASSYDKNNRNCSSILQLFQKDDKIKITTFLPFKRLQKCEANYYKVDLMNAKLENFQFYCESETNKTESNQKVEL